MTDEKKQEPQKEKDYVSYQEKIQSILKKVEAGEEIYKKEEENPLHKKIKEIGVKPLLVQIFKEDAPIGDYTLNEAENEEGLRVNNTQFFKIISPGTYPNADQYWTKLENSREFQRLGQQQLTSQYGYALFKIGNDSEKGMLEIQLLRDEKNGDKPTTYFKFVNAAETTSEDIKPIVTKVGLDIVPDSIQDLGDKVIISVVP